MPTIPTLLLLTQLNVAAAPVRAPTQAPMVPDTVVKLRNGSTVILLETEGAPTAALQLSVAYPDDAVSYGAKRWIRTLALQNMERRARETGALVRARVDQSGLSYLVEGPAIEVAQLGYILRGALEPAWSSSSSLREASDELQQLEASEYETPGAAIRDRLLSAMSPGLPTSATNPPSGELLTEQRLVELWAQAHRPENRVYVFAGSSEPTLVLSALTTSDPVAAPATSRASRSLPAPRSTPSSVQVLRRWAGLGYRVGNSNNAAAPIIALLVNDQLRRQDRSGELFAEMHVVEGQNVLLLYTAAYSRQFRAANGELQGMLTSLSAELTEDHVQVATAEAVRTLRLAARSSGGLADAVGRFHQIEGDPQEAARFLEALENISVSDVRALLDAAIEGGPVSAEIRP